MGIERIGFGAHAVGATTGKNKKVAKENSESTESSDRVELSEKAKLLFAAEKAKRVGEIRAKVKNGFYESPEVTKKVAEGLLRDLKSRSPQS